jgi:hypothetical protein
MCQSDLIAAVLLPAGEGNAGGRNGANARPQKLEKSGDGGEKAALIGYVKWRKTWALGVAVMQHQNGGCVMGAGCKENRAIEATFEIERM